MSKKSVTLEPEIYERELVFRVNSREESDQFAALDRAKFYNQSLIVKIKSIDYQSTEEKAVDQDKSPTKPKNKVSKTKPKEKRKKETAKTKPKKIADDAPVWGDDIPF